jgi:hypothetical protein
MALSGNVLRPCQKLPVLDGLISTFCHNFLTLNETKKAKGTSFYQLNHCFLCKDNGF